jgi:hypothetical protein
VKGEGHEPPAAAIVQACFDRGRLREQVLNFLCLVGRDLQGEDPILPKNLDADLPAIAFAQNVACTQGESLLDGAGCAVPCTGLGLSQKFDRLTGGGGQSKQFQSDGTGHESAPEWVARSAAA